MIKVLSEKSIVILIDFYKIYFLTNWAFVYVIKY